MYSNDVSLKPPFFALTSGVRIARVMTMSSAFLEVLEYKALSAKSSYFSHNGPPRLAIAARSEYVSHFREGIARREVF